MWKGEAGSTKFWGDSTHKEMKIELCMRAATGEGKRRLEVLILGGQIS